MEWQVPVLVSAIVFAVFLVFRMRPAVTPKARARAAALGDAKKRIESAKDDASRAIALADAADACALLGRTNSAVGYYRRALRLHPSSRLLVERAMTGLARRHAKLELLMWRYLASHPSTDEHREAMLTGLRALESSYAKRRRHHPRAQAIAHALEALTRT